MAKKKSSSKALPTFVGFIPPQSATAPQSNQIQISATYAEWGEGTSYTGKARYLTSGGVWDFKDQKNFYWEQSRHNQAAGLSLITTDNDSISINNTFIYITDIIICHTALAGVFTSDFIALRQQTASLSKWKWYFMDNTIQKAPILIHFTVPIKLSDFFYLDFPVVGATEYIKIQIYGYTEVK